MLRVLLGCMIAGLVAVGTSAPAAADGDYPRMRMRMAHAFPAGWVQTKVEQWWAEDINRRSGGKIKIDILWAGAGGAPLEILNLVGSGAVDLGAVPPAYFPNELPLTSAPNSLPLTFTSNAEALRVIDGLVHNVPAVQAELKRNKVWPLYFNTINSYQPLCTKPLKSTEDFRGLRIRSFGAHQPLLWESLGATGVNILPAELYTGLQKGLLDCAYYSVDLYKAGKLYEVAKNLSSFGFGPQPSWPVWINADKWQSLPANVKALIETVSAEAAQRSVEGLEKDYPESLAALVGNGVNVVPFEDAQTLRSKVPDFKAVWLKEMDARGLGDGARAVLKYWNEHDDDPNS